MKYPQITQITQISFSSRLARKGTGRTVRPPRCDLTQAQCPTSNRNLRDLCNLRISNFGLVQ
jgi:hypothetical protein